MDILPLDGSYGEGGGQILRTALSLSAVTGRSFRLTNIRAGRRKPGLMPQHLSAVKAAAAITAAEVAGDRLGSTDLSFAPAHRPKGGHYVFDVAEIAQRGSAGSVTLVLQTILVPLATAEHESTLVLRGGTHLEWSPAFDDIANSYLPALRKLGFRLDAELKRWGWYPVGNGEVACNIAASPDGWSTTWPRPLELAERGQLRRIEGRAVGANLPAHIARRMADRARASLGGFGLVLEIEAQSVDAACSGAGIFIVAEYDSLAASFSTYGRRGKPSEAVADEVVAAFNEHHNSKAAVEIHLADQVLLPLALAAGPSAFTVARPSRHLTTNAWTVGKFGVADIEIEPGTPILVRVEPKHRD